MLKANERSYKENAIYPIREGVNDTQFFKKEQSTNRRLGGLYNNERTSGIQLQSNQEQSTDNIEGISRKSNNRYREDSDGIDISDNVAKWNEGNRFVDEDNHFYKYYINI